MFLMKRLTRFAGILFGVALLLALTWGEAATQQGLDVVYLNGHSIQGDFLGYYNQLSNADLVMGPPLTEAFTDPATGARLQYFARALLIFQNGQVTRIPLGERFVNTVLGDLVDQDYTRCELINTFWVCGDFLAFYNQYGGAAVLGLPISLLRLEGGRYVQYFEFSRFVWEPTGQSLDQRVQLSDLGMQLFYLEREDPARLLSIFYGGEPAYQQLFQAEQIFVVAYPKTTTALAGTFQQIYVIVLDDGRVPVANGSISIQATYPSGETFAWQGFTDANGIAVVEVPPPTVLPAEGRVTVQVAALALHLQDNAVASYRILP